MKQIIDLKEIQCIELKILRVFHDVCEKHNLTYTLMGGTMLGAIRHQGFIPWDDDIDVSMPRPDYDLFLRLASEGAFENYELSSIENKKTHIQHFAKLVDNRTILFEKNVKDKYYNGINIDVFPADGVPDDAKVASKHYKKLAKLRKYVIFAAMDLKYEGILKTLLKYIRNIPFKLIGPVYFSKKLDQEYKKYPFNESTYVSYSTSYALKTKMKKEDFLNVIDVEFCGYKFKCQADFENILTNIYGNYMKLPPEKERISHHNREVYWRG